MISQNNSSATTFLDLNNPQLSKSGFDFSFTDDLEPFARTIIIIVGVTFLLMILCALRACCRESQKRVARNQPGNDETQFDTTELGIICSNHHRPSSASSHLPNPNQLHHHHHNNNNHHHHHLCHHCTQNDLFVPYLLPQPGPAGYIIPPPVAPPTYEESLNHRKDPLDVSNLMVSTSPTAPTYGLNRSGNDNTNAINTNMPTDMGSPAAEVVDARSRD